MVLCRILFNKITLFCSVLVVLSAVVLNYFNFSYYTIYDRLNLYFRPSLNKQLNNNIYSPETLAQFNGIEKEQMYLSILGNVFDVTKGRKHYEKGQGYNFFIGTDGSRSFITGNFSDGSEHKDHVIDLSCADLFVLINWRDTYKKKYTYKGKLIGRYYNEDGKATEYKKQLNVKLKHCEREKKMADDLKQRYPPCNIEWNFDQGTRVWCTKYSGGISRNWAGVPRKLFTPGESTSNCVCIDLTKDNSMALLKEYDNCSPESQTCNVPDIK